MSEVLIGIPAAVIIAAISSWITVQLSLRKFRDERWWERKVDAYTKVIEALHYSKEWTDQHLEAEFTARELPQETVDKLLTEAKQGASEIRRAVNIGAFYFSERATKRLSRYKAEENQATNTTVWFEYLERDHQAVSSCLDDMIEIAKEDLRITPSLVVRAARCATTVVKKGVRQGNA